MVNVFEIAQDAIYESVMGLDAGLENFPDVTVRIIDKTAGVELAPGGEVRVGTLVPAALVRRKELATLGITNLATIINTHLTINEVTWRIVNHRPVPRPGGESIGEVMLILRQTSTP